MPTSKRPNVRKPTPEWMLHRNKMLSPAVNKRLLAPSDDSIVDYQSHDKDNHKQSILAPFVDFQQQQQQQRNHGRISGTTPSTILGSSESDDSMIMISTDGSSGWSTPDETQITRSYEGSPGILSESQNNHYNDNDNDNDNDNNNHNDTEMISESYRFSALGRSQGTIEESYRSSTDDQSYDIIEESYRTNAGQSQQTIEESVQTGGQLAAAASLQPTSLQRSASRDSNGTFETISEDSAFKAEDAPESMAQQQQHATTTATTEIYASSPTDEEDNYNNNETEACSSRSVASFWGNPVRFADPLRDKEEMEPSSENATTDECEPFHRNEYKQAQHVYRQEQQKQYPPPRDWNTRWMSPQTIVNTSSSHHGSQQDDGLPDPPAALDGSGHSAHKGSNSSGKRTSSGTTRKNPWMPPKVARAGKAMEEGEDSDQDDVLSSVHSTIAETMEQLTKNANNSKQQQQRDAKRTLLQATKRIDFAGRTTAFPGHGDGNSASNNSSSTRLRKYYGNDGKRNEEILALYMGMPIVDPAIENPDTDEEELFDWVPLEAKQLRYASSQHHGNSHSKRSNAHTESDCHSRDGYSEYSTDLEASRAFTDHEASRGGTFTETETSRGGGTMSDTEPSRGDTYTTDRGFLSDPEASRGNTTDFESSRGYTIPSYHCTPNADASLVSSYYDTRNIDSETENGKSNFSKSDQNAIRLDTSDGRGRSITEDATESETETKQPEEAVEKKNNDCLHFGIFLIVILVPVIVFGVRYVPGMIEKFKNEYGF